MAKSAIGLVIRTWARAGNTGSASNSLANPFVAIKSLDASTEKLFVLIVTLFVPSVNEVTSS